MYGDKVGAGREGAFDHQGGEGSDDRGLDMAAAQHCPPDRHEVCDRVVAIANELFALSMRHRSGVRVGGVLLGGCSRSRPAAVRFYPSAHVNVVSYRGFGAVQLDTSRQTTLSQQAKLGDDELVELLRNR